MGRTGPAHQAKTTRKAVIPDTSGAVCGAVTNKNTNIDQSLQRIIESWPQLPDEIKATILRIIEAMT